MEDRKIGEVLPFWTWERTHHNYDIYFIVEAEITRILMEGKKILILRAEI